MKILNNINYALNSTSFATSCDIDYTEDIAGKVTIDKSASPTSVTTGDTVTYTVTITLGEIFEDLDNQLLRDVLDERLELIENSLKLDGEVLKDQDLSSISVDFEANSTHVLEYQCLVK